MFLFKGLRERNFGSYEGMLISEIKKIRVASNNNRNIDCEEKDKFLLRIKKSFETLTNLFEGNKLIVVSHGGVLTNFLKDNIGYCKEVWKNTELVIVYTSNGSWIVCNDKDIV